MAYKRRKRSTHEIRHGGVLLGYVIWVRMREWDCYQCPDEGVLLKIGSEANFEQACERVARRCRICGCMECQACVFGAGPCHWVAEDLCSNCS